MPKPLPASPVLQDSIFGMLLIICLVIGFSEALLIVLLDIIQQRLIGFTSLGYAILAAVFLTSASTILLWLFVLRPLQKCLAIQKIRASEQFGLSAFKESEATLKQLKQALDASHDMVLIAGSTGNIEYVNPALCEFSGWSESALIGQQPSLFDTDETDRERLADMQQKLKNGESWSGRLLNRRRGMPPMRIAGQATPADPLKYWVDINITPVTDANGKMSGYVQIQRDITAQVEREAALLREAGDTKARLAISMILQQSLPIEERLTKALDSLFDLQDFDLQRKGGIFLKAEDENYLDLFVLHGQFSEEFIRCEQRISLGACLCGRAAVSGELIISDDCFCDPRHNHRFEGMQAHGHYIVPILSAESILGILFLYTDPYPIQSESRVTMLLLVGDLIALALLQEQAQIALETARDAALQASKIKSDFLSNMSHEIRTPMNGVLGMLDILRDTELSREQSDFVETAANSAKALLAIVNDILDFSKLEAGKFELEQIGFHLPSLVEEVCALQAVCAHAKNLELNCYVPIDLPHWWLGDPGRIRQILVNLIGNAVKFTEKGEISVEMIVTPGIEGASAFRFEVKDSGIGIAVEHQVRLFQSFSQVDSSTARRFGGTGLGLSISKNLIELMGGSIGVESESGEGACFWFSLPLMPSEQNQIETGYYDLSGKRVLVVDDNATNRTILEHYLNYWQMTVDSVDNGRAALEALENSAGGTQPYDLLLLDFHMPEMDGLTLARVICENSAIAAIPRLLLTSGGVVSESELKALGISQSMLKPVRQKQLFEAILNALQLNDQISMSTAKEKSDRETGTFPNYNGKRILIAEDNPVNCKIVLALLAKFQLKPDVAENGQMALDLLAKQPYDLVLMDCQMPVIDGYEATRVQRQREVLNESSTHTPIIALTAHANAEARDVCLAAGMDDYLCKPINSPELTEVLRRWLDAQPVIANESVETQANIVAPCVNECWDEALALKYIGGDQELLIELMQLFIENIPRRLLELQNALEEKDLEGVAYAAHAIKGMTGGFFAEPATSLAAKLEYTALHVNGADLPAISTELTEAMSQLIPVFQRQSRGLN